MLNIRSGIISRALVYLLLNEEKSAYINELARQIDADPMNLYRGLRKLETEGILKSEFKGKERYYSANTKNPLYKNFKEIFLKTNGLEMMLKKAVGSVKGIEEAYIYGSYASGTANSYSDIDILAIGKHSAIGLGRQLLLLQKQTGREINTVSYSRKEFENRKSGKDPFISGILNKRNIRLI